MTCQEAAKKLYDLLVSQGIKPISYGHVKEGYPNQKITINLYTERNVREDLDKIPDTFEGFPVEKYMKRWIGW